MKLLFKTKLQVTWHLLRMFFWEIYEIFTTAFTRKTRENRLLQLVVTEKRFDLNIFFIKHLIRFFSFMFWYSVACVFPGIKFITCSRIKYLNKAYCCILSFYFQSWSKKICLEYSSFIQNISVYLPRILRITRRILNPW